MTDLPSSVKVAYRTYRIEMLDHWEATEKQRFGECDKNAAVIRLDEKLDRFKMANTVLHELIHAIWYAFNGPEAKITEENIAFVVSNGLTTVLRDNPALAVWLTEAVAEGKP